MSDRATAAATNEFARGWRILAGSMIGVAIGVSSLYFYSLGIFIKPLAAEFGWTRGEASLGALFGTASAALMAPMMGRIIDRLGSIKVACISVLLLSAGFLAHAWLISGLTSFLIVTVVMSLLTVGSSPAPYSRLTVTAFVRHRGLALGIILGGTGIGAILIPRLLVPLVAAEGWRSGYLALAIVSAVLLPLVFLFLRTAPDPAREMAPPIGTAELIRYRAFWPLAAMFFLAAVAVLGTVVHFVPMLSDAGLSAVEAGSIAALIGFAAIGGRLVVGGLLDRFPAPLVTACLFGAAAAGLVIMALGGITMAVPGALITGIAVGAEVDLLAFLTARYFPRTAYGQANGLLYGIFLTGGAVGPALSGLMYDRADNYLPSLLFAAALLSLAALIGWRLPRPEKPANQGQIDDEG